MVQLRKNIEPLVSREMGNCQALWMRLNSSCGSFPRNPAGRYVLVMSLLSIRETAGAI